MINKRRLLIAVGLIFLNVCTLLANEIGEQENNDNLAKRHLSNGQQAEKENKYEQAEEFYQKALELKPGYWGAKTLLEQLQHRKSIENWAIENLSEQCQGKIPIDQIKIIHECANTYFSVDGEPINPKMIQDLSTWLSDGGDQVTAINLLESQRSNRYYIEHFKIYDRNIYYETKEERFGYEYIGKTTSGIHVLQTDYWSGGSGTFRNLMLVKIYIDSGIEIIEDKNIIRFNRHRLNIKKIGEISLSSRWRGILSVKSDSILIEQEGDVRTVSISNEIIKHY